MEVIEKVSKSKTKKPKLAVVKTEASPVVDVPKEDGSEALIQTFIKKNSKAIESYLLKEFEELTEPDINTIIREAAECAVLVRSPKVSDPWGDDIQVIENCIKVSTSVGTAPVTTKKTKPKPTVVTEEPVKPVEEPQDLKSEKTEQKAEAKTKAKKSAAKPTTTKADKKADKKTAKAQETKKPTALKGKTKTEKKKVETVTNKVSVDDLKSFKGLDLWLQAGRVIKRTCGTGFIQVHDQDKVIPVLHDHHHKKTELVDMAGNGNKQYGKKRLENYYKMIVAFFKENDLKL